MKKLLLLGWLVTLLFSCSEGEQKPDNRDTPTKGTINISVDETFKPVISEQIKIFESSFPGAKIVASYKPEVECFKDLQADSTRMIIVARGLDSEEIKFFKSKLKYQPTFGILAYDAVSMIVHADSKDTVFTKQDVARLLTGTSYQNKTVVLDGTNATSTVRYLMDSVLKGKPFGKNVKAVNGSKEVVDLVSSRPDAIGFVGSSWVGNQQDPEQQAYLDKIKFALLECWLCKDTGVYAKPSQATIQYGQYPFRRPLYYILKENRDGLGTGLMNFMTFERGQLIFRRAYLAPAKMNFQQRSGLIKE